MADGFEYLDDRLEDGADGVPPVSYPPRRQGYRPSDGYAQPNVWSRFAAVTGLVSGLSGLAFMLHALAPAKLSHLGKVADSAWIGVSLGFAFLTLILVIVARHADTVPRGRRRVGSTGIVLLLCGILFTLGGVLAGNVIPQGVAKQPLPDHAPTTSVPSMNQGIDRAVQTCGSGWKDPGLQSYPGVSQAQYCKSNMMGYVVFDNPSFLSMYQPSIRGKIKDLIGQYGDNAPKDTDWSLLTGGKWLVFGTKDQMLKVQKQWGGTLTPIG